VGAFKAVGGFAHEIFEVVRRSNVRAVNRSDVEKECWPPTRASKTTEGPRLLS
jgi:hypothetical protein